MTDRVSQFDAVLTPRKRDYELAINLLRRQGMAAIESALIHGGGQKGERLVEGAESLVRIVAHLRTLRDEAPDDD